MNSFAQISRYLSVAQLVETLAAKPELWNANTLRTAHPASPHQQADDIWLRFNAIPATPSEWDELESINYPALEQLPEAEKLIRWLADRVSSERIGRVLITRLKPGGRITAHRDTEQHAGYYERFHIVLQSNDHCIFHCGDDALVMKPGECWAFNNQLEHSVENNGTTERVHLIVDMHLSKGIF